MSFYGGTLADYLLFCDDRYYGRFKVKKNEDKISAFQRWLKLNRSYREVKG